MLQVELPTSGLWTETSTLPHDQLSKWNRFVSNKACPIICTTQGAVNSANLEKKSNSFWSVKHGSFFDLQYVIRSSIQLWVTLSREINFKAMVNCASPFQHNKAFHLRQSLNNNVNTCCVLFFALYVVFAI